MKYKLLLHFNDSICVRLSHIIGLSYQAVVLLVGGLFANKLLLSPSNPPFQ